MLKASTCVAAAFIAGLISLACSSSGLKARGGGAGAGSVANGGQAGSGTGGIAGSGGSGGAVATSGADASAASGNDATACFSLFHACSENADCCAPNRCLNITGTLACEQEGPAVGGSTATGGSSGTGGTGGASSRSSGVSCYDSSGTIATTAKTCTLASDCKQVVQPTSNCCGAISEVGLAKLSSCTFPTLPCENTSCPITNPAEQAEDGKNTVQGGSIGLECVGGQCMTVVTGGADAAADATGGATSVGGAGGSGGALTAGGTAGTGGSVAVSDGSVTTDLDSCSNDADCLSSCIWVTAPNDSNQCTAFYCCGMTWLSKKRCEANQAAWSFYCPNQSPQLGECPCAEQCTGEVFACVGGRCASLCPLPIDAAGRDGPTF
jgi:hypothetical protein